MRAPKLQGNGYFWNPPDKEWLEHQYVTLEKSSRAIAKTAGVKSLATILKWLHEAKIPIRGSGRRRDGVSSRSVRGRNLERIWAAGKPDGCEWCGQGYEGSYSLVVHHKDHDKGNMDLSNLQILCYECHRFETALWHARKEGKVEVEVRADGLKLTFPHLRDR